MRIPVWILGAMAVASNVANASDSYRAYAAKIAAQNRAAGHLHKRVADPIAAACAKNYAGYGDAEVAGCIQRLRFEDRVETRALLDEQAMKDAEAQR